MASRQSRNRHGWLCVCAVTLLATWKSSTSPVSTFTPKVSLPQSCAAKTRMVRASAVYEKVSNPVKTVSESIADFYKAYPQPPVLPMYRTFVIDLLTQTHLAVVDARFKYDVVFALGLKKYYEAVMGNYDKLVGGTESEKIWKAFAAAVGLDAAEVDGDAEIASAYATTTSPANILKHMEGAEEAENEKVGMAFKGIGSSLYSLQFSIGLFTMMELAGVEVNKENVEEWAKAMKVTPSKATSDFETYKLNKQKLKNAEEMIREVEIREKKKLAERLEAKAKALAAKAAEKKAAAEDA